MKSSLLAALEKCGIVCDRDVVWLHGAVNNGEVAVEEEEKEEEEIIMNGLI